VTIDVGMTSRRRMKGGNKGLRSGLEREKTFHLFKTKAQKKASTVKGLIYDELADAGSTTRGDGLHRSKRWGEYSNSGQVQLHTVDGLNMLKLPQRRKQRTPDQKPSTKRREEPKVRTTRRRDGVHYFPPEPHRASLIILAENRCWIDTLVATVSPGLCSSNSLTASGDVL
jgi:hypothetical protein